MSEFVRARKPEQKEERRAHLLATARQVLEATRDLDGVGLNELARRAGMTKSNVYRYFESREALLLALLEEEYTAWLVELTGALQRIEATRPPREADRIARLADVVAATVAARPLLGLLTAALPSVLERNLSLEAVVAFKARSSAFFDEVARALAPLLPASVAAPLMNDVVVAIGGLYPHAYPSEAVRRALLRPELCAMARDFERDLARFVRALATERLREVAQSPALPTGHTPSRPRRRFGALITPRKASV